MQCTGNMNACPFPAVRDGLCQQHLADKIADRSLIPSTSALALGTSTRSDWQDYFRQTMQQGQS